LIVVSGGGRRDAALYDDCALAWRELERRGHRITPADGSFGGYQAILRQPNGVYEVATEMRKDGSAGGY
jgi:gamma-glutamyltranspeptidase